MASHADNRNITPQAGILDASTTPIRRAKSAEPSTGRRSIHTPATSGTRRTPGTGRLGLSASTRRLVVTATPHAQAAYRTVETRRAAIFTPGKQRRRSGRDQRETPRDLLRNLSRALAPASRAIGSSSSPHEDQQKGSEIGTILEDDEDDDIPIDRPRLSLPIDVDEEDSEIFPHRSAGLEDHDYTVQSVELPRRAVSEQPGRSSVGSIIRMSDYVGDRGFESDEVGIDSGFFPPTAAFDPIGDGDARDDVTFERLDSEIGRRETMAGGRISEFSIVDMGDNEATFMIAPQGGSSPMRPSLHPIDPSVGLEEEVEDFTAGPEVGLGDESDLEVLEVHESIAKEAIGAKAARKRHVKRSRYGIEYPSLPPSVVKRLAQTFAKTSGVGKAKISSDTLSAIMQASDWFFEQLGDDLQAYAKHAGRKTIDESDMLTLMKRYAWLPPLCNLPHLASISHIGYRL